MHEQQLKQVLEAAIFAADAPLSIDQLVTLLESQKVTRAQVKAALQALQADYEMRGVQLQQVASGYRFQTRSELASVLAQLWQDKPPKYSQALLETLALIAYRQPITRGDIEAVRGVSVSSQIMKTLQDRGWVKVVGHREVPGRPQLYATTPDFLNYFSLTELAELPAIPSVPAVTSAEQSPQEQDSTTAETATDKRVH